MRVGWLACLVAVGACASQQAYSYKPAKGPEAPLAPVHARVVAAAEAEASGLVAGSLQLPIDGEIDGTKLIEDILARADAARAVLVADLAIYLQTTQDGQPVECRSDIVPETVTESRQIPARYESVPVSRPVTRMVTEQQYSCKPVSKLEMRSVTEYQQRCGSVSRPVTRTRTVYSSQYDSFSKSTRQVPHTETYTDYESHYECKSEPISRMKSEYVSSTECGFTPVTHSVTRYEFQLESRYIPPRLETIKRQRLRELDPVCYRAAEGPPSSSPGNRIEGRIFTARAAADRK